jgi:hypothetical protein
MVLANPNHILPSDLTFMEGVALTSRSQALQLLSTK